MPGAARGRRYAGFPGQGPVAVHDPVPQPRLLLPGNFMKSGLDVVRQLACGLAEHGEVPQRGVAALAIGFQVAGGNAAGEFLACPPRRSSR